MTCNIMHRKNKIKKTQLQYRQPYTLYLSLNVFVDKKQGHRAVYRQHGPQEWREGGHGAVSRNGRQPG